MKRRVLPVVAAALASALAAIAYTEVASADPPQQNGAPVVEQNVDANGLLRVHEQGTANVAITGTPTVNVGNHPDVQSVLDTGRPSSSHVQVSKGWGESSVVLFGPANADTGLAITALTFSNATDEPRAPDLWINRGPWREGNECRPGPNNDQILVVRVGASETGHFVFPDEPFIAENDEDDAAWCLIGDSSFGGVTLVGHSFTR